jgi:hypothetical protein
MSTIAKLTKQQDGRLVGTLTTLALHVRKIPRCGADDEIDIAATVWVRLCHDGTDIFEAHNGDHTWDDDSDAQCCACGHTGTVREFTSDEGGAA